jgi:hypothetical protein
MTAVVVAGMHRSGTSLTASVLSRLGVDLGDDLLPADHANVRGYFEDRTFLAFQRDLLRHASAGDARGWRDWGWTESEQLDGEVIAAAAGDARRLLEVRTTRSGDRPWGWKDPRTTLLLDFWHELVPDARFVCVYRAPWEVLDSIVRVADGGFARNPDWALRAWSFYNRRMLDFVGRVRERCLLLDVAGLARRPREVVAELVEWLHLVAEDAALARAVEVVEPQLLRPPEGGDLVERLVRAGAPECVDLLASLDAEADVTVAPRAVPEPLALHPAEARAVLVRWRAAEAERDLLRHRVDVLEAEMIKVREESQARHERMLEKEREAIERGETVEYLLRQLAERQS